MQKKIQNISNEKCLWILNHINEIGRKGVFQGGNSAFKHLETDDYSLWLYGYAAAQAAAKLVERKAAVGS